jgi:hypothetical protein
MLNGELSGITQGQVKIRNWDRRAMITYHQLKQKLADVNVQYTDVFESFEEYLYFAEESTFYIFRTDNNVILARGVQGFEQAKKRASQLRQLHKLSFDQVKFKSERRAGTQAGVNRSGSTFRNAYGQRYPIEYSKNVNPSKGRRFRGYTDSSGNFHDVD